METSNECILDRILDRNRNVAGSKSDMPAFAFWDIAQYRLNLLQQLREPLKIHFDGQAYPMGISCRYVIKKIYSIKNIVNDT